MSQLQPSSVLPERPIGTIAEDQLFRKKFIERLERALINPKTMKAIGVVVGVTGPWGSGKTSVLNLLEEGIKARYSTSLVVRFDPWLVSGRDNIINQFFAELLGSLNSDKQLSKQLSSLISLLKDYSANLAPLIDLAVPGVGRLWSSSADALKTALSKRTSLHQLRKKLLKTLTMIDIPIIVMIDELDRIEDEEVRAIAQLVRAVADFPNISYLLAYDPERVIQALGRSSPDGEQRRYGRAYLEKIVQFQIPLPVSLDNEIVDLLTAELTNLGIELPSANPWHQNEDYKNLVGLLVPNIISNPRDIKRLIGTFHVLEGMMHGEVNWVDLLGYCVLLIKAPSTASEIKKYPDAVVENPISMKEEYWRIGSEKVSADERLKRVVDETENDANVRGLLKFLFPTFRDDVSASTLALVDRIKRGGSDFICYRQHLMTVLRHDILPGTFSRAEILSILSRSSMELPQLLHDLVSSGRFGEFMNRLEDVYPQVQNISHGEFWLGIGGFLRRDSQQWLKTYSPMQEIALTLGRFLIRSAPYIDNRNFSLSDLISRLDSMGDVTFTSYVLRVHVHLHGLFGWKKRENETPFLTEEVTKSLVKSQSSTFRDKHLTSNWVASLLHLSPIYNMIDVGLWDEECRNRLDTILSRPEALDGFTLLLYGGGYSTDSKDLKKVLNSSSYLERVNRRLKDSGIDSTVEAALRKATYGITA